MKRMKLYAVLLTVATVLSFSWWLHVWNWTHRHRERSPGTTTSMVIVDAAHSLLRLRRT